jgi:hypothetical protein
MLFQICLFVSLTCFVNQPACVGGSSDATEIFSIYKYHKSTNNKKT